ncbi:ATP-binding protein [Arcanobacterium wilhelmae]|uniref:ATP-binding protein n=1 Tax=Arcanobacterium wilhelmae TaxID=1803177 RepID=UPI0024156BE5|nr:ATP-binding protein [Arcanobacterium wilhelmae]WFN90539.1 ATP-binding protein [Arcanobacterium wilhelmae]
MRTPLDSPFSPGSDVVPQVWAGRARFLADWRDVLRPRRVAGIHERARTILGEAGSGKSALVRRIAQSARDQGDWVTEQIRIPAGGDPLKRVAEALLGLAAQAGLVVATEKRISAVLARVQAVAVGGASVTFREAEGVEAYRALTELLIELGRAAIARANTMVVVHVDEVQNITDTNVLSQLLVAFGDALAYEEPVKAPGGYEASRALPIAIYLTGLPEFLDMAGARVGATFARRFQTGTLESLDVESLVEALYPFIFDGWEIADPDGGIRRISMEVPAATNIIRYSCGEPFLFQLAGANAWYAGTGDVITEEDVERGWAHAAPEAEAHVLRILERLPAREREFLEAMAALPPQQRQLLTIAKALGYATSAKVGTTARRLETQRGIIARGTQYRFTNQAVEAMLSSGWPYEAPPLRNPHER